MDWRLVLFFVMGVATPAFTRYLASGVRVPTPSLYDWAEDGGLLDVWALEEMGELIAVRKGAQR